MALDSRVIISTNYGFVSAGSYTLQYNSEILQKNLNADMTNPNTYHTIEPAEHVYAEINQKEGYKADPGMFFSFGWFIHVKVLETYFIDNRAERPVGWDSSSTVTLA